MAITLTEARATIRESVLHAGTSTYDDTKIDRGLIAAGNEFLRETNCETELVEFEISSALFDVSLLTGLSDFVADQYMWAHLDLEAEDLFLTSYRDLVRKTAANATTGKPQYIAFPSNKQAYVWPSPDAIYDAKMVRRQPFVAFTPGTVTPDDVDINIPQEWVYSVLWWGCRYHIWGGAPGHPDTTEAKRMWEKVIEDAKGHFPDGRSGLNDRMAFTQRRRGGDR